jgi:hypothetical protein
MPKSTGASRAPTRPLRPAACGVVGSCSCAARLAPCFGAPGSGSSGSGSCVWVMGVLRTTGGWWVLGGHWTGHCHWPLATGHWGLGPPAAGARRCSALGARRRAPRAALRPAPAPSCSYRCRAQLRTAALLAWFLPLLPGRPVPVPAPAPAPVHHHALPRTTSLALPAHCQTQAATCHALPRITTHYHALPRKLPRITKKTRTDPQGFF